MLQLAPPGLAPSPAARPRSVHRLSASAAIVLVLAFVMGILVPVPAFAAPPEEDIQNLPVPEVVPQWVWRADTRHPTEWLVDDDGVGIPPIFEDGFRPKGLPDSWNDNLADHVLNTEQPNRSAWVSTSSDQDEAASFGRSNLGDSFWEYQIAPDEKFWSVQTSFKEALLPDGEYDEALADRFEAAKDSWYGDVEGEAEFAAFGEINEKNVQQARQWVRDADGDWTVSEVKTNDAFTPPSTKPTLEPYDIPDGGVCYGGARATCAPPIDDEDALADLHRDRFDGDSNEFDFSLRTDELREDEDLLLAPAPDSVDIVADYAADAHTPADFEDFTAEIADSFEADTEALAEVTTEVSVIDGVADSLGLVVDTSAEILPYFGIAATGWALKEDISHGDWGDLAADSIAEAVQSAMVVSPELDFILAPVLFVDQIAKEIGDWTWGLFHPAPEYTEAYRNQLEQANDQVDQAPDLLLSAWEKERNSVFAKFYGAKVEKGLAETATAKIRSDVAVLKAMDRSVSREIVRHEFRALAVATTEADRIRVKTSSVAALADLRAVTRAAITDRVAQYRDRYAAVIDATADTTWSLELDAIAKEFIEDDTVSEYLTKVSEIASEAYFQKPFDQLEPWDKEVAAARGDEERQALKALVPTIETSRHWSGPDADQRDAYAQDLRLTVEDTVKNDLKLPTAPTSTTLGVHDLIAKPDEGTTWDIASHGTVSWSQQIGSSATPIDAATGDAMSWRVFLPRGMTVKALPAVPTATGWTFAWTKDATTVTLTATKTAEPADGFAGQREYEIPVNFSALPIKSPTVSVVFTPPSGYQSLAQSGFTSVPIGAFEALESTASEILGTKTTMSFEARVTASASGAVGKTTIRTPRVDGVTFPTRGTLVAWHRAADGTEWVRNSGLDLPRTGTASAWLEAGIPSAGYAILDAGDTIRWDFEVEIAGGPDARATVPWTLTSDTGWGPLATESTVRIGGTSALGTVQLNAPTLAYNQAVEIPIASRVTGKAMQSIGATSVEFRAPEGSSFTSVEPIVPVTAGGTTVPNATIKGITLSTDGRTLSGTIAGGAVNLPVGEQLRWKPLVRATAKPSGPTAVGYTFDGTASSGAIALKSAQNVVFPELATAKIEVGRVTAVKPGQSTEVDFTIRPSAAVTGVKYTIGAPRDAYLVTDVITLSNGRQYTGQFDRDRTNLTVVVPDELPVSGTTVSVEIGLLAGAEDIPNAYGYVQVGGPLVTTRTSFEVPFEEETPEVPDPGAADITITSMSLPMIRQQQWGTSELRLENTGEHASAVGISFTLPERFEMLPTQSVGYRVGNGSMQYAEATKTGQTYQVDTGLPTLRPGDTMWISLRMTNADTGWVAAIRPGSFDAFDRDTGKRWTSGYTVLAALGADMLTVRCSPDASSLAEARIRWVEQSDGYYKATIEQVRVTSSAESISGNAKVGLMLRTDGYEGAWATQVVRRGDWVSSGPGAYAYVRKPKLLAGLFDVEFDHNAGGWSETCTTSFSIFKN